MIGTAVTAETPESSSAPRRMAVQLGVMLPVQGWQGLHKHPEPNINKVIYTPT